MKAQPCIEIVLDSVKPGLRLYVDARRKDSLFDAGAMAEEYNEARYQLVEGCFYDYQISDAGFLLGDIGDNIIQQHSRTTNSGTIAPNIFVGTLSVPLIEKYSGEEKTRIYFEVQSVKSDYRSDYRDMLELITEKCTDLLLQSNSPVTQHFDIDYTNNSQTLYQKFAFIKSVIGTDEFSEAVHRIVTAPVTKWTETTEERDIRNARRFSNANLKEILKGSKRTALPEQHIMRSYGIESLPERITTIRKTDSVDTPENRFIKHALENFLKFCTDIHEKARQSSHKQLESESEALIRSLEGQLHHTVFKDISRPTTLKLNSPVLQRKEGYREVLRVWLMFDLAAKLIWKGGDDIYSAGKKDIATLYEYWLFFKLLELFQSIFQIEPGDIKELIQETADGMSLQIKQGKHTALNGIYDSGSRKMRIRFNYNRSFSGKKPYPEAGSWTTTLRPDYTLSVWPAGITEEKAEEQELIVHIHFDAKYKIANLTDLLDVKSDLGLEEEKKENRKGIYKNADLLKMHSYKDAIRRTGGAYVLYPGDKAIRQMGFHEIIPGLGAFPVKPSKTDSGIGALKVFIMEVLDHFINRTSQREKIAFRTYDIYKEPPDIGNEVREPLPETLNDNRSFIPDETFVLVGYYKSPAHLKWIKDKGIYNFRMDSAKGGLQIDNSVINARYLMLHTKGEEHSAELWKIKQGGFKVRAKETLSRLGYPDPRHDFYLTVRLEKVLEPELKNYKWAFKKLDNFREGRASSQPFTASLAEVIKNRV